MSVGMQTSHGLKFTLSDHVAKQMENYPSGQLTDVLQELSEAIEAAELLPSLTSTTTFIALLATGMIWWQSILFAALAYLIAYVLSFSVVLIMLPPVKALLTLYQFATKLFLNNIVIFAAGIILKPWYAGVAAIFVLMIMSIVMTMLIGGYRAREGFNDMAAKRLMRKYEVD